MKKADRIGITFEQHCGMKATCIVYKSCKDIDIKFEDGTIVEHRSWLQFKKGHIANPYIKSKGFYINGPVDIRQKIGQTYKQRNGMEATCIDYRKADDIDVQFADSTIVKNRSWKAFINGDVRNPNIKNKNKVDITPFLGKTFKKKNGMNATCIAYRGSKDIDVQFEDGTIVKSKTFQSFTLGCIGNPNKKMHRGRKRKDK